MPLSALVVPLKCQNEVEPIPRCQPTAGEKDISGIPGCLIIAVPPAARKVGEVPDIGETDIRCLTLKPHEFFVRSGIKFPDEDEVSIEGTLD